MKRAPIVALAAALASSAFAAPPPNTTGLPPIKPVLPSFGAPPPAAKPAAPASSLPPKLVIPTDPIAARYSAGYEGCMRMAAATLDMLECANRETERWDARLNRAFQSRMSSLNDRQRRALKQAEKAWLLFRDADCAAYQDEDWGTISRIDASQCFLRRTVERTLELESFPADHGPG